MWAIVQPTAAEFCMNMQIVITNRAESKICTLLEKFK